MQRYCDLLIGMIRSSATSIIKIQLPKYQTQTHKIMTAASKSQLEVNAAAVLAGFSRPANDNLRQMFGEMEITFPMKVRTLAIEKTEQFSKESLMFNH